MELFKSLEIELVGLCLAGLVLVQFVFEMRKHRRGSSEPPPRIVCLDGELGGFFSETGSGDGSNIEPDGEVAGGR